MHLLGERLPVFWKQREMRFYPVRRMSLPTAHPGCITPLAPTSTPHEPANARPPPHPPPHSPPPTHLTQGWCFALPAFVFRLPYALLDATLWSLITYWAVGFDNSWRFVIFWLLMFLTCAWSTSLFQAIACVCKVETISNAVGSFFLLVFMATGG
jgi:hypothetical protein